MEGLVFNQSRKRKLLLQIEVDKYYQKKETNYDEEALAAHVVYASADQE